MLTNFLCHRVLLGGLSALAPMTFFLFETLSCYTSLRGKIFKNDLCDNSLDASLLLSFNLAILFLLSVVGKTLPANMRPKELTYDDVAVLKLKSRQKLQGVLLLVTVLTSMFTFSTLGVKGKKNDKIYLVGCFGSIALALVLFIEMKSLAKERKKRDVRGENRARVITLQSVSNEMVMGDII